MKHIPINENNIPIYNKKAIKIILLLVICGIITGLILSAVFVNEANYKLKHPFEAFEGHRPPPGKNNSNYNLSQNFPYRDDDPLTTYELILPTFGVIIVCISTFLLIGLVAVYIKIFFSTNSKYIVGLLLFLIPLLIQSLFLINTMHHLFESGRFAILTGTLNFGLGGLGGILILVSFFEIIGLSILLYLSTE